MEVEELLRWSWKPLTSLEMTTDFWCHLSHVPLRAEPSDRAECVNEVLAGEKVQIRQKGRGHWVQVALHLCASSVTSLLAHFHCLRLQVSSHSRWPFTLASNPQ